MGEKDAEAVSKGGARVLEERFGRKFHCYTPALIVKDGQSFDYGNVRLTVLEHPGHTEGTISILAEGRSGKIFFTGDLFTLKPCTPDDEIQIEIIRPGSPDYNEEKNLETLRRLRELPPVDMVAPGHGSIWLGDSRELFETLYRTAKG